MARNIKTKTSNQPKRNSPLVRAISALTLFILLFVSNAQALAATITVDNLTDFSTITGNCELREAITSANGNLAVDGCAAGQAMPVVDNIDFSTGPGTIVLNLGELPITEPVNINGDIDADNVADISITGDGGTRIMNVSSGNVVPTTVEGLNFLNGSSSAGGAVLLQTGSDLTVTNSKFRNNHSTDDGGAIKVETGANLVVNDTNPDVTGETFDNNTAENDGGAIESDGGTVTLGTVKMVNNQAGGRGGAIHQTTGDLTLASATNFSTNHAFARGGAICLDAGNLFTTAPAVFDQNTVGDLLNPGQGGALFVVGDSHLYGDFTNNTSTFQGGAIYSTGLLTNDANQTNFYGNSVTDSPSFGGAIFLPAGSSLNLENASFGGVLPGQGNSTGTGGDGGAIYSQSPDLEFTNVDFINNVADNDGGGLYMRAKGISLLPHEILFTTGNLNNNQATNGSGGAVYLHHGTQFVDTTFDGLNFNNNSADVDGGALYSADGGGVFPLADGLRLRNSLFEGNTAGVNGGAVSFNPYARIPAGPAPSFNSFATDYNDNHATLGSGGAIWCNQSGGAICDLLINGDEKNKGFDGNTAGLSGGAIATDYLTSGVRNLLTIITTFFTLNTSVESGGAIAMNVDFSSIDDTIFDQNQSDRGGAISIGDAGEDDLADDFVFSDNVFTNNSSFEEGGALHLISYSTAVSALLNGRNGNNFSFNHADISGGAIYAKNFFGANTLNITIENSDFNGNSDVGGMSAIYNTTLGFLNITNSNIHGSTTIATSPTFAVASTGAVNLLNTSIFNNSTGALGIFDFLGPVNISSIINSTISGNTFDGFGAVFSQGFINLISSTIAYNIELAGGAAGGGGLVIDGETLNIENSILTGNSIGPESTGPDCSAINGGTINSLGYNSISNVSGCTVVAQPTDVTGNTVPLTPLALNGGGTFTHLISGNSPALDSGNSLNAPAQDQNFNVRPVGLASDMGSTDVVDTFPPNLLEVIPVPTPSLITSPSYTFTSDEPATFVVGGSCSSASSNAVRGSNSINFNTLPPGTYSNCTIAATDLSGNPGAILNVTPFTINAPAPAPVNPPSGGGGSPQFGQPSCSGSGCLGNPNNPPITPPNNPPSSNPPSSNPPTTSPTPNPISTISPSTAPAITGTNSNSGKNNFNKPQTNSSNPIKPADVKILIPPTQVKPTNSQNPPLVFSPLTKLSSDSLTIITPEENQLSADDSPFVLGTAPSNSNVELYIFNSLDFDRIRNNIAILIMNENAADPSRELLSAEQLQSEFDQRFTNAVITILQKHLNNSLNKNIPDEAIFIDRVAKLGDTDSSTNKLFILDSEKSLRDNQYLIIAKSLEKNADIFSKEVPFTIDSTLKILTPEVESIGNKSISIDTLVSGLHLEIEPGNLTPSLVGKIKQPSKIIANWQSEIQTSALIADTLDEQFRLSPPKPLEPGEHTVYVTAYRRSDNAQSKTLKINFKTSEKMFNNETIWLFIAGLFTGFLFGIIITTIIFRRKNKSKLPPSPSTPLPPTGPLPSAPSSSNLSAPPVHNAFVVEAKPTPISPVPTPTAVPSQPAITTPATVPAPTNTPTPLI